MRIYGGHDYYDSALAFGGDPKVILVRKKHDLVEIPTMILADVETQGYSWQGIIAFHVSVMFAGVMYYGLQVQMDRGIGYFWSAAAFRNWCDLHNLVARCKRSKWGSKRPSLDDYFSRKETAGDFRSLCIDKRYAILVEIEQPRGHRPVILLNPPVLKSMGFARALDPFTAYQELSMWVGGILGGMSPEIVSITDDKVLATSHGFDKHSFRSSRT